MSVPSAISLETLKAELAVAAPYAEAAGIQLETRGLCEDSLQFVAVFVNRDGELFPAEFDCQDYPMFPPTIEFLNSDRLERGLPWNYPSGFHTMPCICMRYNRKAHGEKGGPHGDWRLIDWQLPTPGGGAIDTIGMILSDLHAKIGASSGRLG